MDSTQLSPDQLRRLRTKVECQRRWLCKLVMRMDALGFDSGDRLHQAATDALLAMQKLERTASITGVRHGALKAADPYGPRETTRA